MIGGGEWFPLHPPRGDGPALKVSFIVTTTGPHPPGWRCVTNARCAASVGGHRSDVSARESLPCMARYDNAYYQTMRPGRGGREILGRHRPGEAGAFRLAPRPGAWGGLRDPSAGHGALHWRRQARHGGQDRDQERQPRRGPCPTRACNLGPCDREELTARRTGSFRS